MNYDRNHVNWYQIVFVKGVLSHSNLVFFDALRNNFPNAQKLNRANNANK